MLNRMLQAKQGAHLRGTSRCCTPLRRSRWVSSRDGNGHFVALMCSSRSPACALGSAASLYAASCAVMLLACRNRKLRRLAS